MGVPQAGKGAMNEHDTCRWYSGARGRRPHLDKVVLLCVCCIFQETRCETKTALTLINAVPVRGSSPRGKLLERAEQLELEDRVLLLNPAMPGLPAAGLLCPGRRGSGVCGPISAAQATCDMRTRDVKSLVLSFEYNMCTFFFF